MSPRSKQFAVRAAVTLIFVGVGVLHFTATDRFLRVMPFYLRAQRELVLVSGAFEILGGLGVWAPWQKLRRLAGYGLVALLLSVFVVNIDMAIHGSPMRDGTVLPSYGPLLLWLRLPLQFVLIWMAMYATRDLSERLLPTNVGALDAPVEAGRNGPAGDSLPPDAG